jgi:hypothetical protein
VTNNSERLQEHLNTNRPAGMAHAARIRALERHALDLTTQAKQACGAERAELAEDAMAAYRQLFALRGTV